MKKMFTLMAALIMGSAIFNASQAQSTIKGEEVTYSSDGTTLNGYVAYNSAIKGPRPAVIIIHEWWGSNDYVRMRARKLAQLGYVAFALDMYGGHKIADNPTDAQAYATPFYQDPLLAKARIEAAVAKVKEYSQTDPDKIAAIGYCFGGSMVLNAAKLGMDFKGVVSFHGGLAGVPATDGGTKANILVCHGAADKFISAEELKGFRHNLDSVKTPYTFISYPNATHAFTNQASTAVGKKFNIPIAYNAAADKKSWEDMKVFLKKIFK